MPELPEVEVIRLGISPYIKENTVSEINNMLKDKIKVLKYLVNQGLDSIEQVGKAMSLYYTEYDLFMKEYVQKNKSLR